MQKLSRSLFQKQLVVNDVEIFVQKATAKSFNKIFSRVWPKASSKIPHLLVSSKNFLHGYYPDLEEKLITHGKLKPFENNCYTSGVFIDLKKVSDTVDHNILLKKSFHHGVRDSLQRLQSYLKIGKQYIVSQNTCKTEYKNVICGVPQGSILGSLLFVILYTWSLAFNSIIRSFFVCRCY